MEHVKKRERKDFLRTRKYTHTHLLYTTTTTYYHYKEQQQQTKKNNTTRMKMMMRCTFTCYRHYIQTDFLTRKRHKKIKTK